jgi:ABC-type glycerol-3-phosphate transport system permease component
MTARRLAGWLFLRLALLLVIVVFGMPFLWTLVNAVDRETARSVPWPRDLTLDHFRALFDDGRTVSALRRSAVVATASMLLATASAALAGFGISRMSFRRKTWLAYAVLLLQTVPLAVTMVPIYDLAVRLGLQDTWRGLILSHAAVTLPMLVWLMKGFIDTVPHALEDAAMVDGASELRAWLGVVLPAAAPGIAVVAGFAFAAAWSEVIMVVLLVTTVEKETLPFQFYYAADGGADIHATAALGVLYVLPVLVLFLALRRLMVGGMVSSIQNL